MSLTTFSKFYYGHSVDSENNLISFSEGGPEIIATINTSDYSLEEFAIAVATALNSSGALTYTVTVLRGTPTLRVAATGTFELLVSTGTTSGTSAYGLMGFTGADRTAAATYDGDSISGSVYEPQFILQDHVAKEKRQNAVDATVQKSASGKIEVVRFGLEKFVQFNLRYNTDIAQSVIGVIISSATGVADTEAFMQNITTKAPFEYMPDKDSESTFDTLILERTPQDPKGTGYDLKEQYGRGLPGYFDSGILLCRVVE